MCIRIYVAYKQKPNEKEKNTRSPDFYEGLTFSVREYIKERGYLTRAEKLLNWPISFSPQVSSLHPICKRYKNSRFYSHLTRRLVLVIQWLSYLVKYYASVGRIARYSFASIPAMLNGARSRFALLARFELMFC